MPLGSIHLEDIIQESNINTTTNKIKTQIKQSSKIEIVAITLFAEERRHIQFKRIYMFTH